MLPYISHILQNIVVEPASLEAAVCIFNGTQTVGLITKSHCWLVCDVSVGLMFNEKSKQLVSVLLVKSHCLSMGENPHCVAECAGFAMVKISRNVTHTTDLRCWDWSCFF